MQNEAEDSLVDVNYVAQRLGVSTVKIWRMRAEGKLPEPMKLGGHTRWKRSVITAFIEAGCPAPQAA